MADQPLCSQPHSFVFFIISFWGLCPRPPPGALPWTRLGISVPQILWPGPLWTFKPAYTAGGSLRHWSWGIRPWYNIIMNLVLGSPITAIYSFHASEVFLQSCWFQFVVKKEKLNLTGHPAPLLDIGMQNLVSWGGLGVSTHTHTHNCFTTLFDSVQDYTRMSRHQKGITRSPAVKKPSCC